MGMVFSFFCSRIYLLDTIFYPRYSLLKNCPEDETYSSQGLSQSLEKKNDVLSNDNTSVCSMDSFDDLNVDEAQEITFDKNFNEYIWSPSPLES